MTDLKPIIEPLLLWYRANRKEMPWRLDPTPYHVWLSEIMLQQTRIEAAIPYYERFLAELPTVEDLAAVPDDKLMKLWEGLGYYSRARNLKKAAQAIVSDYGGVLPSDAEKLRKLPGIGEYTAGAIASIAYGKPEPAVDGNVLRVLARLCADSTDILLPQAKKNAAALLSEIYPTGSDAGAFTQALMELGEVICIPNGEPKCELCPIRACCRAFAEQATDRYPVRSPKKGRRMEKLTVLLLRSGDAYAVCRREKTGLLAGMWQFPNLPGHVSAEEVICYLKSIGLFSDSIRPCGDAKHVFTHVEWEMHGYLVECEQSGGDGFSWKTAEAIRHDCAIPTAFRFYENLL
ncbi:MAG: A/G-specific adenine glycosylase [Ruminococcus sp.]|nr:A/G-specific adenine glycosylase [Candidatus Apopatosoma intestinale]